MGEQQGSLQERVRTIPREGSDRLLQAVDELRALEREKRLQEASSAPLHELERRVEEKARAVFRLAQQEGGAGTPAVPRGRTGRTGGSET
jgi:signal transduction histidine kinase